MQAICQFVICNFQFVIHCLFPFHLLVEQARLVFESCGRAARIPRRIEMNADLTAQLLTVALVVYGTSLHEMGHAFVATWLGDPTPGKHGRLTFNPLPHLSPFITAVVLPLVCYMSKGFLFAFASTP